MKIVRNDTVEVIRGKDRGHRGKVHRALPKEHKVLVEGAGVVTKHVKGRPGVQQAGIIKQENPIDVSKVMLVCPNCNRPTRVGYRFLPDGTKVRYCKHCEEQIPARPHQG